MSTERTIPDAGGWLPSLLFWACLVVSGTLYAGVALSPKVFGYLTLKHAHYENQVRLVTLERQTQYLGRVIDALESDPDFADQLARVDFDASRPGDERIAVGQELSLDARGTDEVTLRARRIALPWYVPLLSSLAEESQYRYGMLTTAAVLTVVAFTFLPDSPSSPRSTANPAASGGETADFSESAGEPAWRQWLRSRYRQG